MTVDAPAPSVVAPRYLWVPEHPSSGGAEAAQLAESIGFVPDAEQRLMLDVLCAEREDGRWATREDAVIVARQNLKSAGLEMHALSCLFLWDLELLIWTAHQFKTTQEAFRDLDQMIAGTPWMSRRVKNVWRGNGEEGFELVTGQRLLFAARSKGGGRGFSGDVVYLDEAYALDAGHMSALLPTLSARPNAKAIYASSAGLLNSAILRTIRRRGRAGGDRLLSYLEWCGPDGPCQLDECDHAYGREGCILDDEDAIRAANPAVGRRVQWDAIRSERALLDPVDFARERLGWWTDPAGEDSELNLAAWESIGDPHAAPDTPVCIGVDVGPSSASASIVACGSDPRVDKDTDPVPVLEVIATRPGASWVPKALAELAGSPEVAGIYLDPTGPAGSLIPTLEAEGIPFVALKGAEVTQACGAIVQAVVERTIRHRDESALNAAVAGCRRRAVGDAFRWSRRDSTTDLTPLTAATWAHHGWVQQGAVSAYDVMTSFY